MLLALFFHFSFSNRLQMNMTRRRVRMKRTKRPKINIVVAPKLARIDSCAASGFIYPSVGFQFSTSRPRYSINDWAISESSKNSPKTILLISKSNSYVLNGKGISHSNSETISWAFRMSVHICARCSPRANIRISYHKASAVPAFPANSACFNLFSSS